MGIIYENTYEIKIDENAWYEIYEVIDTGCFYGCSFEVEISFCKKIPLTDEEIKEEKAKILKQMEKLKTKIENIGKADLKKPNFKEIMREVSRTRKGTPEHEEALNKLRKAHREWQKKLDLKKKINSLQKQLDKLKRKLKNLNDGRVYRVQRIHLITRHFIWDEANEEHIKNFINKFINDREYREKCIEGETEWIHISRIYIEFEHLTYQIMSQIPNFLGYASDDKIGKYRFDWLHSHYKQYLKEVYHYIRKNIGKIISNSEYKKAVETDNLREFVKKHLLSRFPIDINEIKRELQKDMMEFFE